MQNNTAPQSEAARPRVVLQYWGRRGGGSLFTLLLAQHLTAAKEPVDVILSLSAGNNEIDTFRATGLPILTINRPNLSTVWRQGWRLPKHLRMHADELASLKPDVVIITMNSPLAWPFISMLQKRGLKVFYVAHDATPHPGDYATLWQRTTQDLLIKSAYRVVTLSRCVAQPILRRIPQAAEKTSVLSLETVYPTKRSVLPDWRADNEPVRLLFYGRLLSYKGLDRLAQALAPLRSRPGWRLTIAGSGPLEGDIKRRFLGWPQVDLELGWISEQRTDELFSSHHLLLCPYSEASQSGVVAEALSWAVPSLVMPAGALPEQVGFGTAGIVTETMDARDLHRSLVSVLEHPGRLLELSQGAASLLMERQANQGWVELLKL